MLYFFLVLGYLYAGIPSIIYSVVMEFFVNPLVSNHVVVIGISTILGALAGSLAGSLVGALPGFGVGGLLAFLGLVPGFVTGLYLRWSYVKAANKSLQSDTATAHLRQNVTNAPKWPDED
jgi:hypothetical protein